MDWPRTLLNDVNQIVLGWGSHHLSATLPKSLRTTAIASAAALVGLRAWMTTDERVAKIAAVEWNSADKLLVGRIDVSP
jgi:hypothetical protein